MKIPTARLSARYVTCRSAVRTLSSAAFLGALLAVGLVLLFLLLKMMWLSALFVIGAVALAALLSGKIEARDRTSVLVLSGGNVDPALFAAHRKRLPPALERRAEHFFGEMRRVARGVAAWRRGSAVRVAQRAFAHPGLAAVE